MPLTIGGIDTRSGLGLLPQQVRTKMSKLQKLTRLETGPIQLGDDWPGVVIRGDDAIGYTTALRRVVHRIAEIDDASLDDASLDDAVKLAELADLLESCRVTHS
jgi:hypothetical protein